VEARLAWRIGHRRHVGARDRVDAIAKKTPLLEHCDVAAVEIGKAFEREGFRRA
jgi:hypothetical protein